VDRALGRGMRARKGEPYRRYDTASIRAAVEALRLPDGGLHPGWLGGGLTDEPDLALIYGYARLEEVNEGLSYLFELLPDRLAHAELSNDAVAFVDGLRPLDAFVIGFAHRPRAVAALSQRAARSASGQSVSPWGTGIFLMPYDDPERLAYAPGPWEVRASVYAALAGGARGLEFYPYHQGEFVWQRSPHVWSLLAAVLQELRLLAPLTATSDVAAAAVPLEVITGRAEDLLARSWAHADRTVILAVNLSSSEPLAARLAPAGLAAGDAIDVLFEARSIEAVEGAFTDSFGPFDARAYVLRR